MNGDLTELVQYLDKKFQENKESINDLKSGVSSNADDIHKLILNSVSHQEFEEFRKENKQDHTELREDIRALTTSNDRLIKHIEILTEEYSAISVKVDRHERWLQQVAEKVGVKLE